MKMVLMNYYVGVDDEVKEILDRLGVCTYTRVAEVEGRISCGEPREGTHVWPGANSTLFVVLDDAKAEELLGQLESFNAAAPGEGVDAYVLSVEKKMEAGPGRST